MRPIAREFHAIRWCFGPVKRGVEITVKHQPPGSPAVYPAPSIRCSRLVRPGAARPPAALLPRRRMRPVPPFLCVGRIDAREREAMFDGGMWGLVRLLGTGCARRES
ncbi:hypothetical protein EVG18_31280 [Burkholderia pyrrocinia]|nr:hypothetical protein EVG18_31280 [Burkholderia pyrrocinia]